jgi:hypothetical protein
MNRIHPGYPFLVGGDDMSGYRIRTGKATAALWLLVVLADAAWVVTSGTAVLFGTLAIVTVAALLVLVVRTATPPREPIRVRARARH